MFFEAGKKYIFSAKKYFEDEGKPSSWVDRCDGKEVKVLGRFTADVSGLGIVADWCIEADG